MKTKTQNPTERTYSVKPQDFIPFVGSFIYQKRNWKDENRDLNEPQPYDKYFYTGIGLTAFNMTTGIASLYATFQGLEALLK